MTEFRNNIERLDAGESALLMFALALGGQAHGENPAGAAVDGMDRTGQAQLINSDVLPVDAPPDAELAALGFTLGGPVPNDPLFRYARDPDRWTRHAVGTRHVLLRDDTGASRLAMRYSPLVTDRFAACWIETDPRVDT